MISHNVLREDYKRGDIGKLSKSHNDVLGSYYIRSLTDSGYTTYIYNNKDNRDKDFNLLHFKVQQR